MSRVNKVQVRFRTEKVGKGLLVHVAVDSVEYVEPRSSYSSHIREYIRWVLIPQWLMLGTFIGRTDGDEMYAIDRVTEPPQLVKASVEPGDTCCFILEDSRMVSVKPDGAVHVVSKHRNQTETSGGSQ